MAKRKWDQESLMKATGQLLTERGYHGFHFGALIGMMKIQRTTMYDHFKDKDDLMIAYTAYSMGLMMQACNSWEPQGDPFRDLTLLLEKLTPFAPFLSMYPSLNPILSKAAAEDSRIEYIRESESELRQMIFDAVGHGQWSGSIRKDVTTHQITEMLLHALRFRVAAAVQTIGAGASATVDSHVAAAQMLQIILSGIRKEI